MNLYIYLYAIDKSPIKIRVKMFDNYDFKRINEPNESQYVFGSRASWPENEEDDDDEEEREENGVTEEMGCRYAHTRDVI